jgi:hypothetical protein
MMIQVIAACLFSLNVGMNLSSALREGGGHWITLVLWSIATVFMLLAVNASLK